MDDVKKLLGMFSPAYGAITGQGPMGRMTAQGLVGRASKQYRNEQAADAATEAAAAAAAAAEVKKKRDAQFATATSRPVSYKKGGTVKADRKQDKAMIKSALHKHERAMHPGKPMTKLRSGGSASSRADGIAQQGKTRGKYI